VASHGTQTYLVVIERGRGSWGAYCPDLPGLGVLSDTREGAEQLMLEAVPFHIDGLRNAGESIPKPSAVGSELVRVTAA
jgi:predicted RNase H-like HicB family nuclease